MSTAQLAVLVLIAIIFLIVNLLALTFHAKTKAEVTPFQPEKTQQPPKPTQPKPMRPQRGNQPRPSHPPQDPFPHAA